MKSLSIKSLSIVILLLCAGSVSAQTWPKFLGDSDPSVVAYTPKFRIKVFTGGFDLPHRKIVEKKLPKRLLNQDVPLNTADAAQDYARRITGQFAPSTMLDDIDASVDRIINQWDSCGGSYSRFIHGFDWSSVTITVRDTVVTNPSTGQLAYGVTMDKRNAHIVNLSFWYWFSDPSKAQLVVIYDIAAWELGNVAVWNYYGHPKDIGTGRPCQ